MASNRGVLYLGPGKVEVQSIMLETSTVRLTINGEMRELRAEARRTVLDALREDLMLTGTKKVAIGAIAAPAPCWWRARRCMPV